MGQPCASPTFRKPGLEGTGNPRHLEHTCWRPHRMPRILIILSEWGFWGEELIGPMETFDQAGYQIDFATPKGKRPVALPPSMDPDYIDPPLGRGVTCPEAAVKGR